MIPDHVRGQLDAAYSDEKYQQILALWKHHSISEDQRSIEGLMSTLTEDCEYVMRPSGTKWQGKAGATRFYTELLSAFPDIKFELQNIVIGPQGVYEEADVTGTLLGNWQGWRGDGQNVEFTVQIFFPWDEAAGKFRGEIIHLDYDRILARYGVCQVA